MFGIPQGPELIVILVIVLIVFGAGKLPSVMRDFGRGVKEFKKAQAEEEAAATTSTTTSAPASVNGVTTAAGAATNGTTGAGTADATGTTSRAPESTPRA